MFAETEDAIAHLDAALGDTTIPERLPGCDKSLLFALSRCIGDPVATIEWRRAVTSDLLLLAEEFEELELETFMEGTPPHVHKACKFHGRTTNIPSLGYQLRTFENPEIETQARELKDGFPMLGKLSTE